MKKIFIFITLILLFGFAVLSTTAAITEKEKGYISVNTSDNKEISPDLAEITIEIETSDKLLQKASQDNKEIAGKVYSNIKALLGAEDSIKTNNYTAKPLYIYTKENKRIFDKYVVNNTILVRTKKTDIIPKLIDTAIAQGAKTVKDLSFLASDYDNICNEILAELTKKAYNQAFSVSKSINSHIAGIKSINAVCNSESSPSPRAFYGMMSKAAADNESETPVESGKIKIYANIAASFYVK